MTTRVAVAALGGVFALALAGAVSIDVRAEEPYAWKLTAPFPPPPVPASNPMSAGKVELGRHLFYDTRMSGNGTQSCGTCHEQARAFTDGKAQSVGSTGQVHPRGSMSLVNIGYATVLTWANPTMRQLEDQALVPMYGDHPVELGLIKADDRWLESIGRDPIYQRLFPAAFGSGAAVSRDNVVNAIASFERTIVSARSPWDRYHFDRDVTAVSESARRGEVLFHSRALSCFTCHGGTLFSGSMPTTRNSMLDGAAPTESRGADDRPGVGMGGGFHNTGLYNIAGVLSYPPPNTGIYEITKRPQDVGRFKAPTLRNVAVTAPYMHDGSVATLEDAIAHYAAGGRTIADGLLRGVGHDNPNKSDAVQGFSLTAEQRADLIAFLRSLTDEELLRDPRFANPWKK